MRKARFRFSVRSSCISLKNCQVKLILITSLHEASIYSEITESFDIIDDLTQLVLVILADL